MPRRMLVFLAMSGLLATSGLSTKADPSPSSLSWPTGQALPHFAAPQHLDVADVSSLPGDQQLLLNTLEGLVNRTEPRIYLLWASDEGSHTWIDTLHNEFQVPVNHVEHPRTLLRMYHSSIRGMIVYDPGIPDSVNIATSLAGPYDAVVASPTLATMLAAAPYHLPVVQDLRGRFASKLDAYQWEYDHLWVPKAVTHRMLVGLPPFRSSSAGSTLSSEPFASLRDYSVASGAMVVWLDPTKPAERLMLEKILTGMPPDSPYLGTHPGDVLGELNMVTLLSQHSTYELAADYFNNGSVFGGVRPALTPAPAPARAPALDPTKIYVTFTMSDGDNIQYDQRRLRYEWDSPSRGSIPINWTISPLLLDAAPAIFDHYTRSATANDLFMAGPSGAGYAYPSSWPDNTFPIFTRQTGAYMHRAGITTLDILNAPTGLRMPLSDTHAQDYIEGASPTGMLLNYYFLFLSECRTDNVILDGTTPVTEGCVVFSSTTPQAEAELEVSQQAKRCPVGQPCFISIEFIVWNVTPTDVVAVASTLQRQDPRYVFVRADQYFELLRQANGVS